MRKLKTKLMTTAMMLILALGTSVANAGIIIADFDGGDQPCNQPTEKVDSGIIIADIIGIIIADLTGIIIADASEPTVNCGIIIAD